MTTPGSHFLHYDPKTEQILDPVDLIQANTIIAQEVITNEVTADVVTADEVTADEVTADVVTTEDLIVATISKADDVTEIEVNDDLVGGTGVTLDFETINVDELFPLTIANQMDNMNAIIPTAVLGEYDMSLAQFNDFPEINIDFDEFTFITSVVGTINPWLGAVNPSIWKMRISKTEYNGYTLAQGFLIYDALLNASKPFTSTVPQNPIVSYVEFETQDVDLTGYEPVSKTLNFNTSWYNSRPMPDGPTFTRLVCLARQSFPGLVSPIYKLNFYGNNAPFGDVNQWLSGENIKGDIVIPFEYVVG